MRRSFWPLLLLLLACASSEDDLEERATRIGRQLRCPVCRGVPIAESPAALAQQMMGIVREQVQSGKSDAEILQYFEERYGEWVLLDPKPHGINLAVWVLPVLGLGSGVLFIMTLGRRRRDGER